MRTRPRVSKPKKKLYSTYFIVAKAVNGAVVIFPPRPPRYQNYDDALVVATRMAGDQYTFVVLKVVASIGPEQQPLLLRPTIVTEFL